MKEKIAKFIKTYVRKYDMLDFSDSQIVRAFLTTSVGALDMAAWYELVNGFGGQMAIQVLAVIGGSLVFINYFLDDLSYREMEKYMWKAMYGTLVLITIAWSIHNVWLMVIVVQIAYTVFFTINGHFVDFHYDHEKETNETFDIRKHGSHKEVVRGVAVMTSILIVPILIWFGMDAMTFVFMSSVLVMIIITWNTKRLSKIHNIDLLIAMDEERRKKTLKGRTNE